LHLCISASLPLCIFASLHPCLFASLHLCILASLHLSLTASTHPGKYFRFYISQSPPKVKASSPLIILSRKVVPVSEARAHLPSLLEKIKGKEYLILAKRYQPKAALVDLDYFNKLISIYQAMQKEPDFGDRPRRKG